MKPLVIYHANCNDGFGSALIASLFFKGEVDLWKGYYQSEKLPDCKNRTVYMVDFSYPREAMEKIQKECKNLFWMDHHASSWKEMEGFKWTNGVNLSTQDENISGVGLAWEHFFGAEAMPKVFQSIQDWDTWKFLLPNTREIHFALHSFPQDINIWKELVKPEFYLSLVRDGQPLLRKHDMQVDYYVKSAFKMDIAGHIVPMVNAPPEFASDVGNILSKGEKFAGIYFENEKFRNFSLRSQKDGMDVSEICKMFDGGGHKQAAGFKINIGRAPLEPKILY